MNSSNSTRLIYTLSSTFDSRYNSARLKNYFYLSREPKSDEKLAFTENYMKNLIRTACFMFVFNYYPLNSMSSLIFCDDDGDDDDVAGGEQRRGATSDSNGQPKRTRVRFSQLTFDRNINWRLDLFARVLDEWFGSGFSQVVYRPLSFIYEEYNVNWKYYPCNSSPIYFPNEFDFIEMYRFCNIGSSTLSPTVVFLLGNGCESKYKLQQYTKNLQ